MHSYTRVLKAALSDVGSAGKINSALARDCETVPGSQPTLILCAIDLHYLHRTGAPCLLAWSGKTLFRHQYGFGYYPELGTTHYKSGHFFLSKKHKVSALHSAETQESCKVMFVHVSFSQRFFNILDPYYTKWYNEYIRQSKNISDMLRIPNTISFEFHNTVIQEWLTKITMFSIFVMM